MRIATVLALLMLALVTGACGGDDAGDERAPTAGGSSAAGTQPAGDEQAADGDEATPREDAPEDAGDETSPETTPTAPPKPDPAAEWRAATAARCAGAKPDHASVPELTEETIAPYARAQRTVAIARRSRLRLGDRPRRVRSSVRTLLLNYDLYVGLLENYGDLKGTREGDDVVARSVRDLERELQFRADRLKVGPCGPLTPE